MATKQKRNAGKAVKPAKSVKAAKHTSGRTAPGKVAAAVKTASSAGASGAVIKRGDLFAELDAWFERALRRSWPAPFDWGRDLLSKGESVLGARAPRIDVINRDKDVLVRAELPGVQRKDIEVSLNDRTLTIRASSSQEKKEDKGDFVRREIARQSFARTLTLPGYTDTSAARADLKDGVLEVVIPKQSGPKAKTLDVI
jgi:HSP20 family protein